ncbi:MAG: ABC transporter permease [Balneolaceae bacterium]|nr:ABC transporter permease [Balneolaceae bacterium]
MKLLNVFSFELFYQARRFHTWLAFLFLVFFAFIQTMETYVSGAQGADHYLNAPFIISQGIASGLLVWLVTTAFITGNIATRDSETGMYPLAYTSGLRKPIYVGGRFLASYCLNAFILLALPFGVLLATQITNLPPEVMGPFLPSAYASAFFLTVLPTCFIVTSIQFSFAILTRQSISAFAGSLFVLAVTGAVWYFLDRDYAILLDPTGVIALTMDEITGFWSTGELNTRLPALENSLLINHLIWTGVGLIVLLLTISRFRFSHTDGKTFWNRFIRKNNSHKLTTRASDTGENTSISIPDVSQEFGFKTSLRQTQAIAFESFRKIAQSWSGLALFGLVGAFAFLTIPAEFMNVPLIPRTDLVLYSMTNPGVPPAYFIIPLLIIFWSGIIFWKEKDAGIDEITDTSPASDTVFFLGKFIGLGLLLVLCMAIRMAAGILAQLLAGYFSIDFSLYAVILFGLELSSYLLLGMLVFSIHILVNRKYTGLLTVFFTLLCIAILIGTGIGHELVVPGASPAWSYTEMSGFGGSLKPWMSFKVYWAAWVLLLTVAIRLVWPRSKDSSFRMRLRLARQRITGATLWLAIIALTVALVTGGFIFYNTTILNEHRTPSDQMEQRAEYEKQYNQYEDVPQPRQTGTSLHVEIYPKERKMEIFGTYHLVNDTSVPVDTIHLATEATPRRIAFDREFHAILQDQELGYHVFVLDETLKPNDSLRVNFEVLIEQKGFSANGMNVPIKKNGTFIWNYEWLPAIGYQTNRELRFTPDRENYGLAPRESLPSPFDVNADDGRKAPGMVFKAVIGTTRDQVAIAPGVLQQEWIDGGRRYFRYATATHIGNQYSIFSADYELHEEKWKNPSTESGQPLSIQIYRQPGSHSNPQQMVQSIRASLEHYSREFGAYPFSRTRVIEHPGFGRGMHAEANTIDHEEGFSLINPVKGPLWFDLPFFVLAHEVAHQWWGYQLTPARAEGSGLLVESLASYSAYQVLENTYGAEHLRRFLNQLRLSYNVPRSRAAKPLLKSNDAFHYYRKGPLSLYALSQYIGREPVNGALRSLLEKHHLPGSSLPTSLDLYRELQSVTPDSLQYLLYDLFETNTYWEFETQQASAKQTDNENWEVTINILAQKNVVSIDGSKTEKPIDDWVEIGVFGPAKKGYVPGKPIYRKMHHINARKQTITVIVPQEPVYAGIDPYKLLIDLEPSDNIKEVQR